VNLIFRNLVELGLQTDASHHLYLQREHKHGKAQTGVHFLVVENSLHIRLRKLWSAVYWFVFIIKIWKFITLWFYPGMLFGLSP